MKANNTTVYTIIICKQWVTKKVESGPTTLISPPKVNITGNTMIATNLLCPAVITVYTTNQPSHIHTRLKHTSYSLINLISYSFKQPLVKILIINPICISFCENKLSHLAPYPF